MKRKHASCATATTARDVVSALPSELIRQVLSYVEVCEVNQLVLVSKLWYTRVIYERLYPSPWSFDRALGQVLQRKTLHITYPAVFALHQWLCAMFLELITRCTDLSVPGLQRFVHQWLPQHGPHIHSLAEQALLLYSLDETQRLKLRRWLGNTTNSTVVKL